MRRFRLRGVVSVRGRTGCKDLHTQAPLLFEVIPFALGSIAQGFLILELRGFRANCGNVGQSFECHGDLPVFAPGEKQIARLLERDCTYLCGGEFRREKRVITNPWGSFAVRLHRLNAKPRERFVHDHRWRPLMPAIKDPQPMRRRSLLERVLEKDNFAVIEVRVANRGKHRKLGASRGREL